MGRLGATLINSINWKAEKGDDVASINFLISLRISCYLSSSYYK